MLQVNVATMAEAAAQAKSMLDAISGQHALTDSDAEQPGCFIFYLDFSGVTARHAGLRSSNTQVLLGMHCSIEIIYLFESPGRAWCCREAGPQEACSPIGPGVAGAVGGVAGWAGQVARFGHPELGSQG